MRIALCLLLLTSPALAGTAWQEIPDAYKLDEALQNGKVFFARDFSWKEGRFKVMYEPDFEVKQVSGRFLVGYMRYTFDKPVEGGRFYPKHDEVIMKLIADCPNHIDGTLETTYKLKGKLLRTDATADRDLNLMQVYGNSNVHLWCAFAEREGIRFRP